MSGYTKGPWKRRGTEVYFPDVLGGFSLMGCPDADGNAALCAAAPDLLEALERITRIGVITPHRDWPAALEQARTAIAKARGEA